MFFILICFFVFFASVVSLNLSKFNLKNKVELYKSFDAQHMRTRLVLQKQCGKKFGMQVVVFKPCV